MGRDRSSTVLTSKAIFFARDPSVVRHSGQVHPGQLPGCYPGRFGVQEIVQ